MAKPHCEYVIYEAAGAQWGIQFEGTRLAVFPTKAQAIRAAVSMAYATATPDAPTLVCMEGVGGEPYVIWNSAMDSLALSDAP